MVATLLRAADSTEAILVAVSQREVRVAIERDGVAETWAYRGGTVQTVESDIEYVDQSTFNPDRYPLDDVGALFRAARAVSGSDTQQELHIVDYSGGIIATTVTTTPESRAVFFNPDGELIPTLDLTTESGLTTATLEAVGARTTAHQLVMSSRDGVYLDVANASTGIVTRYRRAPRTPLIITTRQEGSSLDAFDPRTIDPAVVWRMIESAHEAGDYTFDQAWTCVADDREETGKPRLYCQVGQESFVATLNGTLIEG